MCKAPGRNVEGERLVSIGEKEDILVELYAELNIKNLLDMKR